MSASTTGVAERRFELERGQLRKLRAASLLEGTTLLLLLFVAAPLKRLADWPTLSAVLGPVHGLAFLFYCWVVIETVSGGGWRRTEIVRLLLSALVPFGGFANLGLLRRKTAELASGTNHA